MGEVVGVGEEVTSLAADLSSLDDQREGDGVFGR